MQGRPEGGDGKSPHSVQALVWSAHTVYDHLGRDSQERGLSGVLSADSAPATDQLLTCSADFWISASLTNTSPSATPRMMLIPAADT